MRKTRYILSFLLVLSMLAASLVSCKDTSVEAPQVREHLTWAVGAPLPTASAFVISMPEGMTVRFAEEYTYPQLGTYPLKLIFTDEKGKITEREVSMTLVLDTEPPSILGTGDFSVYVGDGVSYRAGVSVTDNCYGEVKLSIDSSAVDTAAEGCYPVIYTATDAAGNVKTVTVTVYVYREAVTQEMLWVEIDRLIANHVSTQGSRELQARDVYQYVYFSISYSDSSDKSDWVRAAYEGLRTGEGDCFTYFALSKAFFIRLGIESKDIQRTEGIVTERHYWNLVNIGTPAAPRWYHFDACHLRGETPPFGCLLTDAQIAAFSRYKTDANGVSNYFYAYDSTAYPATDVTIITKTAYD